MVRFIAKYRHIITAIVAVVFIGCMVYFGIRTNNMKNGPVQSDVFAGKAMGTAIKKTIYSDNTAENEEVNKMINTYLSDLEKQLSVRVEDSEVAKCNRNYAVDGVYELSDDIVTYLKDEMQIGKETDGALSPCIRPISDLWGIEDGKTEIPDDRLIQETLKSTNMDDMEVAENGVIFHAENMAIDFGAVGKGIACDGIAERLAGADIQGAVISVGGSILVYGDKGDGRDWHIGIQNPRAEEGEVFGIVDIEGNKMISTSGDYEKYFEADGKRYHHIFDPATGYPADSGLISVTIISDSGFLSDAMSTACFVMGLEDGMAYAEEKGVEAIFVTDDKKVYITKGLKKNFRLQADDYELEK